MDERKFRVWIEVEEALPDGSFDEHGLMLDAADVARFRTRDEAIAFGNRLGIVGEALWRSLPTPPPPTITVGQLLALLSGLDTNRLVVVAMDGWYRHIERVHMPEIDGGDDGYQAVTLDPGAELDPRDGRLYE